MWIFTSTVTIVLSFIAQGRSYWRPFPSQSLWREDLPGAHLRRGRMCVCADCLFGHAFISHWWPWVSPLLWLPFDNLSLWQATVEPGHRWKRNTSIYHPATSGGFQIWLCAQTDTLSAPQQRAGLLIAWKLMAESYFSCVSAPTLLSPRLHCYLVEEFVSAVVATLCNVSFLRSEWVDG